MVASQEALATQIGVDILKRGGNAVDAAVAVGFALAVTLPQAGNLGGGGFMLVHDAESGETVAIDYREKAPVAASRDMFLDAAGNADPELSQYSGLADRRARHGRRAGAGAGALRHDEPRRGDRAGDRARRGGRRGHAGPRRLARRRSQDELKKWPSSARIFFKPDGSALRAGRDAGAGGPREVAAGRSPTGGPDAFYKGEIAQAASRREMERAGGLITDGGPRRLPGGRARAGARRPIAATRSSRCRRPPPAACTSSRS